MNVLIYSLAVKTPYVEAMARVIAIFKAEGFTVFLLRSYHEKLEDNGFLDSSSYEILESPDDCTHTKINYIFTLGGDGTILGATAELAPHQIPILGLNLGRMGFLAHIELEQLKEAILMIKRGMYRIEERTMLHVDSNFPMFQSAPYGLNDFTLLKRDTSSMITIHTYINGDFLNSYWADGIILATPTGSTGYNLSCGGPIIFPDSQNFVLTPVAPHNLSVRPIVLSDESVLSFEVEGRGENFLSTLDSRYETITQEHQIAIRKSVHRTKIIMLQNSTFLRTMRDKLAWGADARNA
ncbi:MAG: NAD kinase [Saprospiraceae bacterium]|nr:NAD kinase [Saprospiraceae bacterium]